MGQIIQNINIAGSRRNIGGITVMGSGGTGGGETGDRRVAGGENTDSRSYAGDKRTDSRKNSGGRRVIKKFAGEVSADDMRIKILKLLLENQERGIVSDAGTGNQHRDLCSGEQGR